MLRPYTGRQDEAQGQGAQPPAGEVGALGMLVLLAVWAGWHWMSQAHPAKAMKPGVARRTSWQRAAWQEPHCRAWGLFVSRVRPFVSDQRAHDSAVLCWVCSVLTQTCISIHKMVVMRCRASHVGDVLTLGVVPYQIEADGPPAGAGPGPVMQQPCM